MAKTLAWGASKQQSSPMADKFVNLKKDETAVFRVFSEVTRYSAHWLATQQDDGTTKRKKFICPEVNCPICKRGEFPKATYSAIVLWCPEGTGKTSLSDRLVKILEFPKTVYKEIDKHALDEDYGYPDTYDIKVLKTGMGLNTTYAVTARPVDKCEKLSGSLKQKVQSEIDSWSNDGKFELESIYKAHSPEQMLEFLGVKSPSTRNTDDDEEEIITAKPPRVVTAQASNSQPKVVKVPQPKVAVVEEDDDPPFDLNDSFDLDSDDLTVENLFD